MTESGCRRRGGADVARILFAHDTTEFGGVEMVILRTLERLDRSRFQPVVLVPGTSDPDRASPAEFIDRVSDLGVDVVEYSVREVRVIGPAIEIGSIARAVRSVRPDVVHLHTCRVEGARKVVVGARIARVPVVLRTEHNSPTAFSKPPLDSPNRRIFDRLTDRVVTVSEHDRSEQIELVGRSPNRVVAIRNGVDHLEFDPRSDGVVPVLLDGMKADRITVGAVGRFTEQKGYEFLIRAHALMVADGQPVELLLVGDGPLDGALRGLVRDLSVEDSVIFAGRVDDPRCLIASMDIGVMPSLHEGFSLSLLEMMALERPTVITDHPGLLEAVEPGTTSLVVERRDPVALAQAIGSLVGDARRRIEMGAAARERVVRLHTLDAYVRSIEQMYESLLADQRAPA